MEKRRKQRSEMQQAKGLLRPAYVAVPVAIGLLVVAWMFVREYENFEFSLVKITTKSVFYFLLAWVFMAGRDFGLTWRFRSLTDHDIKWGQALRVNLLCEFTSAVTPSTVGGSSFGMIYLTGEGLKFGRATAIMMTTLFLDELFFVLACPIAMMLISFNGLFEATSQGFADSIRIAFWIVYVGLALWTVVLFLGIFVKPQAIKRFLCWLFSMRLLHRWHAQVEGIGDSLIATSLQLKQKKLWWWLRAFMATALSWISRYMVVNALFLAFAVDADQIMVLVRQLVVWVVLTVCPTPGGSGVSEWIFTRYYGDMIAASSLALVMALCWRFVSYYIYLIIGICVIPSWLRGWARRIKKRQMEEKENGNDR